jgi:hypothetical protein
VPNFGSANRRIMGQCVLIGPVHRLVEDLEARQERWAVIS